MSTFIMALVRNIYCPSSVKTYYFQSKLYTSKNILEEKQANYKVIFNIFWLVKKYF